MCHMTSDNANAQGWGMKGQDVSVIIPTQNRPHYLEQSVASVLNQTHKANEIIIIDDGSDNIYTDAIEQIASLSPIIKLYRYESSKGPGYARNLGLEKATGDYVLFLDDDDLLNPCMVSDGLLYFRQHHNVDVVICAARTFNRLPMPGVHCLDTHALIESDAIATQMKTDVPIDFADIQRFSIPIDACLVRRRAIGSIRFPEDLLIGEDTFFWLSLRHQGVTFHYYNAVKVFIRQHHHNSTRSKRRYHRLIQNYQNKLLTSGMLTRPRDIALTNVQLAYFKLRLNPVNGLLNSGPILRHVGIVLKALSHFLLDRLRRRQHSLWSYF